MPETSTRGHDYLELIAALMDDFARARDPEATARAALARIRDAMEAEAAALFMLEGDLDDPAARLVCRASVSPSPIDGLTVPAGSGIVWRALRSNTPQLVADAHDDPDFFAAPAARPLDVCSVLCAPLWVGAKPLGVVELINRRGCEGRFDERDREALALLARAAALAIANARLTSGLMEHARLKRELELASSVQRMLLPGAQPASAPVHGLSLAARDMSGDFYDILPLPGGRIAFALADVSGKGINAALVMVKVATLFRSFGKRIHEPGRLLARIEAELCERISFGMFVTMVVGVYDPARHEVRIANAGHLPPLLRDARGGFREFPADDPPLGVVCRLENNRYRETRIPLAGGALYLYTDGVTEARGAAPLEDLIETHHELPAERRLEAIAAPLQQAEGGLRDDLTLLVIDDGARAAAVQPARRRRQSSVLVTQTLAAQPGELRVVRRLVESAARLLGAPHEWVRELTLAVDEACQNIIRHGYRGDAEGCIRLCVRRRRGAVEVELVDFAPPVGEAQCRGRELEDVRPGGLGTHFMRQFTDSVRFAHPPPGAGNRLVLVKKLPPHSGVHRA